MPKKKEQPKRLVDMTSDELQSPFAAIKRAGNRTAYRRGAAFERRVMVQLELLGWQCFRVAGSRGLADIVAVQGGEAMLVQAKSGAARMTESAKGTFIAFAQACGATAYYADQRQGLGVRIVELETGAELG